MSPGSNFERWHVGIDVVDQGLVVGACEEGDAGLVARFLQALGPQQGNAGVLIDLEHALFPPGLVRLLVTQGFKTPIADIGRGLEMLELGRIGPRLRGLEYQILGALQVPVVIGGDIRNEIGRITLANGLSRKFPEWHLAVSR